MLGSLSLSLLLLNELLLVFRGFGGWKRVNNLVLLLLGLVFLGFLGGLCPQFELSALLALLFDPFPTTFEVDRDENDEDQKYYEDECANYNTDLDPQWFLCLVLSFFLFFYFCCDNRIRIFFLLLFSHLLIKGCLFCRGFVWI